MDSTKAVAEQSTPHSLYYTSPDNSLVQAEPVTYDTKLTQSFANVTAGQNAFYVPPGNGIKNVLCVFEFSADALSAVGAGVALPRGWGYNALQNCSWRVSGSQQYFLTGSQLLAKNLLQAKTQAQKDAILSLGGEEWNFAGGSFPAKPLRAFIPMSFWSSASNDFLETPVASDLLGSQLQVTATLNPVASVFQLCTGGTLGTVPSSFSSAYFQVEQLTMRDRSQSLVSRPGVDLNNSTYVQALRGFHQQEITIAIPVGTQAQANAGSADLTSAVSPFTVNGFMAGQVRGCLVYLTKANEPWNASVFKAPDSVEAIFAGQIYASYRNGTSKAWNMIDSSSLPYANASELTQPTAPAVVWTQTEPALSEYAFCPFSQPMASDYEADILVGGLSITNGSITLNVATPDYSSPWVLHVVPVLNCAISYSRGSANVLIG